ncbi:hypothetical protein D3C81_1118570 [compost metagenome]
MSIRSGKFVAAIIAWDKPIRKATLMLSNINASSVAIEATITAPIRATDNEASPPCLPACTTRDHKSCAKVVADVRVKPATTAITVANATPQTMPKKVSPPTYFASIGTAMLPLAPAPKMASRPSKAKAPNPTTNTMRWNEPTIIVA